MVLDGAPVQLSHVLCCFSIGQVRKRAAGWAWFLAKVGNTSEYLTGSHHSTAAIHVCRLRSLAVVRPEMSSSKSYSCPLGWRLALS